MARRNVRLELEQCQIETELTILSMGTAGANLTDGCSSDFKG
jgi:hypothetical protein